MPLRYSGDVTIRIKIAVSGNYLYDVLVSCPAQHPLGSRERYRCRVGLSVADRAVLCEDSSEAFDKIAHAALSFAAHDVNLERMACSPDGAGWFVSRSKERSWPVEPELESTRGVAGKGSGE